MARRRSPWSIWAGSEVGGHEVRDARLLLLGSAASCAGKCEDHDHLNFAKKESGHTALHCMSGIVVLLGLGR
jgi:hypothetical protein